MLHQQRHLSYNQAPWLKATSRCRDLHLLVLVAYAMKAIEHVRWIKLPLYILQPHMLFNSPNGICPTNAVVSLLLWCEAGWTGSRKVCF